jgi:hypothetical protein
MSSDELYCIHVEQLGLRYPDGWRARYAWKDRNRCIESQVVVGDELVLFVSVLAPDGTVQHFAEEYKNSPRERAIV